MKALFIQRSIHLLKDFCAITKVLKDREHNATIVAEDIYFDINTKPTYKEFNQEYMPIDCYESIAKIFIKEQPDILVVGHDRDPISFLCVRQANKLSIPTLSLQEGFMDSTIKNGIVVDPTHGEIETAKDKLNRIKKISFIFSLPFSFRDRLALSKQAVKQYATQTRYGLGETTKMALMGEYASDIIKARGGNPEKLVVTGTPRFDSLVKRKYSKLVRNDYDIKSNEFVALIVNQPYVEDKEWTEEKRATFIIQTLNQLTKFDNIKIILKLHPRETQESYDAMKKIIEKMNIKNAIILKDADTPGLIYISDLIITIRSTVTLEALLFRKPIVGLNFLNNWTDNYYDRFKSIKGCNSYEELYEYIKKVRKGLGKEFEKALDDDIEYYIYKPDGKASMRVADLMEEMVDEK